MRDSGIDVLGDVPWGTHFCQFYQDKDDLIDVLVPYFKAGLESNEFCMWVTAEPLGRPETLEALGKAVPNLHHYLATGQLLVLAHDEWYLKDGFFDLRRVLDGWVKKLDEGLAKGYDGLRLSGNTAWLEKRDWRDFAEYEAEINGLVHNRPILALCSYALDKCGASEVIDVVKNHKFALIRREGEWELIESSEHKRVERERQRLLDEVERRAAELEAIISAISDGLIIYGPKGEIVRMNEPAEQMLGLTEKRAQKLPSAQRVHLEGMLTEEGQPIPMEELPAYRALRGEVVMGYRYMIHQPDGTTLHLLSTTAPLKDAQGNIIGAVANLADITQLVELIRLRDEVSSTIAHDIRQPLTIIQGQAQVAERSLAVDRVEPVKTCLGAIVTSARRMNAMIQDLVDSVRLEAGRLELKPEPTDLGDFLRDLLQRLATSMDVERVNLSVEEGVPPVPADPDRLERILLNLVSNALKYSDPETPVDLRVTRNSGMALVAVQDRGGGIAREDLPHIFERYYKPKGPRKKESLGLGLYIARMLVETHGGRIWAESKLGQGTTFYFTLPLAPER